MLIQNDTNLVLNQFVKQFCILRILKIFSNDTISFFIYLFQYIYTG